MAETPTRKDAPDKTPSQGEEGSRKKTESVDQTAGGTVLIEKPPGGRSL